MIGLCKSIELHVFFRLKMHVILHRLSPIILLRVSSPRARRVDFLNELIHDLLLLQLLMLLILILLDLLLLVSLKKPI